MVDTWLLLLSSRKAWVGIITVLAIGGPLLLRIFDKIPSDAMIATMTAIAGVGATMIGSIAVEDASSKKAQATVDVAAATRPAEAPHQTVNVNQPANTTGTTTPTSDWRSP